MCGNILLETNSSLPFVLAVTWNQQQKENPGDGQTETQVLGTNWKRGRWVINSEE